MPLIEFSELQGELRVELTDEGNRELWHRVEEFGGVKKLSNSFDFSQSKMYNWKNKDLALPVDFVRRLMGQNSTNNIKTLKGKGSSGKIKDPNFPLNISNELLTRIDASSTQNSEGIPVYLTPEKSLADRFIQLLDELGDVEYKVYSRRSRVEVRYPKFLQDIFSSVEFNENLSALIDEIGEIKDGKIVLKNSEILVEEFNEDIFSREKKFELALQRGNSQKIARLMAEESERVKSLFSS